MTVWDRTTVARNNLGFMAVSKPSCFSQVQVEGNSGISYVENVQDLAS